MISTLLHQKWAGLHKIPSLQTKNFAGEDVEAQTEQVLKNLGAILKAAGSDYSKVIKTTVLLESMDDFAKVNAIYGKQLLAQGYCHPCIPPTSCYPQRGPAMLACMVSGRLLLLQGDILAQTHQHVLVLQSRPCL